MNKPVFTRTGGPAPAPLSGRLGPALRSLPVLWALCLGTPALAADNGATAYVQRNLVSDGSTPAEHVDPSLINPWGIAVTPGGLAWVAANGNSASNVYDSRGNATHGGKVKIEVPGGSPTGVVANDGEDFEIATLDGKSAASTLIFVTKSGIISGWSRSVDPANAIAVVDNTETGAVYTGAAIAGSGADRLLYVVDFHGARIDVFDAGFQSLILPADAFKDPAIPAGFAPFGIAQIDGKLYVSYARQDEGKEDAVAGPGQGFVSVFDGEGHLVRRLAVRGRLNAPWGMALAPANFGQFSGHLLVANSGDGKINAYKLPSGEYRGQLHGADGRPLAIEGLWGIGFGKDRGNRAGPALLFTAGPGGENQGLYGRIEPGGNVAAAGTSPQAQAAVASPAPARPQPRLARTIRIPMPEAETAEAVEAADPGEESGLEAINPIEKAEVVEVIRGVEVLKQGDLPPNGSLATGASPRRRK